MSVHRIEEQPPNPTVRRKVLIPLVVEVERKDTSVPLPVEGTLKLERVQRQLRREVNPNVWQISPSAAPPRPWTTWTHPTTLDRF